MPAIKRSMKKHCQIDSLLCGLAMALLSGCASVPTATLGDKASAKASDVPVSSWLPRSPPAGFLLPKGVFENLVLETKSAETSSAMATADSAGVSAEPLTPRVTEVLLYASPSTQKYFASGGMDGKFSGRLWEAFLRKYKIPFRIVPSVDQLEKLQPGVLLLPSDVALSERERLAIGDFRARGGGVLATWLTGVRGENGEWRGFQFMEKELDAKVIGNTESDENVTYLMPYGDSPITHHLAAGQRVWMERAKEWYPLRLEGRHTAGQVMDWGRTFDPEKPGGTIVFDERAQSSGRLSRSVVLGYPERLWLSSDPKMLEAVSHNALMWLLRQPDAYLAAWPYPYTSAFVMVVDTTDVVAEVDSNFAKMVEDVGGLATYYVLTDIVPKSADILKKIQARGHEIAFLGDRYEGFKDQSSAVQAKRLDGMRKAANDAGVNVAADAGFHAPLESYDKTTEELLSERRFRYFLTSNGASDTRLPFFSSATAGAKPMVVLPRTQIGPEDAMEEGDPEVGLQTFLNELTLAENMAGLSLIRVPNQSLLTKEQLVEIFKHLKAKRTQMWIAPGRQVAEWWRARARVSTQLDVGEQDPQLTVKISGEGPLDQAVAVWVNLPAAGSSLRLVARDSHQKTPRIARVDNWRDAVVLAGLTPGEYRWSVYFDRPATSGEK